MLFMSDFGGWSQARGVLKKELQQHLKSMRTIRRSKHATQKGSEGERLAFKILGVVGATAFGVMEERAGDYILFPY